MPEPVERKCDRHSATRVTAEVYKAGVARMVGDGHSPRTGALVAMSTGWQVTSVDPVLGHHGAHPVIERLHCLRGNIEAFPDLQADIVLAPHSHAPAEPWGSSLQDEEWGAVEPAVHEALLSRSLDYAVSAGLLTVSGEPTFSRAAWMPGSMLAEAIAMPMARAVAAILMEAKR